MGEKSGNTSKVAAGILLIFNFIIMFFCMLLIAFSLWTVSSPRTISTAIQTFGGPVMKALLPPEVLNARLGVAIIVLAMFFFFVSFMGFYGAINRSPFLLFMYSTLVLLLMLLECALMYYFSSNLIEKGLQEQDGQWTHALRLAFKCCEFNQTLSSSDVSKLPWSCCGTEGYPANCTSSNMYQTNCSSAIPSWLSRYQTALYASIAVLHIILSSCSLLRRASSASRLHS